MNSSQKGGKRCGRDGSICRSMGEIFCSVWNMAGADKHLRGPRICIGRESSPMILLGSLLIFCSRTIRFGGS